MAKKKQSIKISKKLLKKIKNTAIIILIIALISWLIYSSISSILEKQLAKTLYERNLYCNTTWQDYVNEEVVVQMTEYIAKNCRCFYENIYTMDQLASMCVCSCELYDLNGTLISNDFRPLFSAIK
ncbi:MAG: hypothetical protein PHT91_00305 [Candidatus Nanoarchaeia archaeon]|nr:hypothetical protein [Candidatus Nanoarchaeia archaeon]MDD5499302.1 hypothetical protein [Candidatus Nanoarchaeia archaeon]